MRVSAIVNNNPASRTVNKPICPLYTSNYLNNILRGKVTPVRTSLWGLRWQFSQWRKLTGSWEYCKYSEGGLFHIDLWIYSVEGSDGGVWVRILPFLLISKILTSNYQTIKPHKTWTENSERNSDCSFAPGQPGGRGEGGKGRMGDKNFQDESSSIHRGQRVRTGDHRHRRNKDRPSLLIRSRHENGNLHLLSWLICP